MTLPGCFCWTRFGTEAAQTIDQIFHRKEEERLANEGVFLWGIGNAIGPSVKALLERTSVPEVVFSPIKTAPRNIDMVPEAVVAWTSGETLDGSVFSLPECSLVTSRYNHATPREAHYALVCQSDRPLALSGTTETVDASSLRNLVTGRPVGASQVTAIVQHRADAEGNSAPYRVAVRANLVRPYFVRLVGPVPLAGFNSASPWADIVRSLWEARMRGADRIGSATVLQRGLVFDH